MLRRIAPAAILAFGLGFSANAAYALPPGATPNLGVGTENLTGISPDNLAGLLNYCVELQYLSYDEGNPPLDGLIAKYKSVNMTGGSMDYATGTAGYMTRNGTRYDMAALQIDQRKTTCQNAVKAAQPML